MLSICLYRDIRESEKYKASKSRLTFPVGLENDIRYVVDTLDNSGSILIAGCSQCGKTMFLKSVLKSIVDRNTQDTADIYIFTRKADELASFRHSPMVAGFTSDFGEMNDTCFDFSVIEASGLEYILAADGFDIANPVVNF